MHIAIRLCILAAALCTSTTGLAGGFFRRAPEVGEWARYEIIQEHTPNSGKAPDASELNTGTLLLKCVGEEMIDERRCLWVESCYEMQFSEKLEYHSVFKVLMPEDEMLQGTLTQEDIRGWFQADKADPVELTFSDDLFQDSGGSTLRFLNAGAVASTGQMSSRTIVVSEEQVELTYSENSPLPIREYETDVVSGEITIWPHDDLAFGVASLDFVSLQTHLEDSNETLNETRFYLVETGTDAVSDLPDHN